jgi:hypothetical protein
VEWVGNRPPGTVARPPEAGGRRRLLLLITTAVTVVSLATLAVAVLSSGKSPLTPR